jgi:hypothetical protein
MRIERFEDIDQPAIGPIEAWQLARELTHKVHGLTKKQVCSRLRIEGTNLGCSRFTR